MTEILIGVDRSEHSRRAVEFAVARAKELDHSVVIAHVIPWSPFSFTTPAENEYRHAQKEAEIMAATEQIVEPLVAYAREQGVSAEGLVLHGDPVDDLIRTARRRDSGHIVLGRTGDSRMRQAIFGSIPAHLVQQAPVPVTVIP